MTERDQFIQNEVSPMLESGERILFTAYMVKQPGLIWQILLVGGLLLFLMTKAYYVAVTNRRIILIRTKQGMFKPKMVNVGREEISLSTIQKVTTSGFANNRSMTFHQTDGKRRTLRIAPWSKLVTGQKDFLEKVPQAVSGGTIAAAAAA